MVGQIKQTVLELQQQNRHRSQDNNGNRDGNKHRPSVDTDNKLEYEAPPPNGPFEKQLKGKTVKWCAECRNKRGLWTGLGRYPAHFTSEHVRGFKLPQADQQNNPPAPAPAPSQTPTPPTGGTGPAGMMASDFASGLDFVQTDLRANYAASTSNETLGNDYRGC